MGPKRGPPLPQATARAVDARLGQQEGHGSLKKNNDHRKKTTLEPGREKKGGKREGQEEQKLRNRGKEPMASADGAGVKGGMMNENMGGNGTLKGAGKVRS